MIRFASTISLLRKLTREFLFAFFGNASWRTHWLIIWGSFWLKMCQKRRILWARENPPCHAEHFLCTTLFPNFRLINLPDSIYMHELTSRAGNSEWSWSAGFLEASWSGSTQFSNQQHDRSKATLCEYIILLSLSGIIHMLFGKC